MERGPADDIPYFALTGDLVSSRELPDRARVQRTLTTLLAELNEDVGSRLSAPLKVVAGDEVQGLLNDPEATLDVVVRIADALHPVAVAWGLGRGGLSTDLTDDVSLLDGPCLHRARDALDRAASEDRWLETEGFAAPHGDVLSALFQLVWTIRSSWTDTQMKYVREVRHRNQTDVAKLFGVSRQAVSKALDAARFSAVEEGEEAIRRLLRWIGRRQGEPEPAAR